MMHVPHTDSVQPACDAVSHALNIALQAPPPLPPITGFYSLTHECGRSYNPLSSRRHSLAVSTCTVSCRTDNQWRRSAGVQSISLGRCVMCDNTIVKLYLD